MNGHLEIAIHSWFIGQDPVKKTLILGCTWFVVIEGVQKKVDKRFTSYCKNY